VLQFSNKSESGDKLVRYFTLAARPVSIKTANSVTSDRW
jgi:hypothetical protein